MKADMVILLTIAAYCLFVVLRRARAKKRGCGCGCCGCPGCGSRGNLFKKED